MSEARTYLDSSVWEKWPHYSITTPEGIKIHYVEVGPSDGTPVVMLHGWPDLWFGWRYQIQALSSKYRLIVPDVRGFGQSSTPQELESYGSKNISNDLVALLDELKIEKAVFAAHDWGAYNAWRFCLYHPERVIAVCGVCTPFVPPRKQYLSLDDVCKFVPQFQYQQFLADAKNSGKVLDASPRRLLTAIFRRKTEYGPKEEMMPLHEWLKVVDTDLDHTMFRDRSVMLSENELQYYVDQYTQSKFTSANRVYGTKKIDFETEKDLPGTIEHPALFIGAADDPVLKPEMAKAMPTVMPNLQMEIVEDAGHWILFEQPEAVNTILSAWLDKLCLPAPLVNLLFSSSFATSSFSEHDEQLQEIHVCKEIPDTPSTRIPKHFGPASKHKAALSTGITVEYALHENEVKVEDAPEERVILIMGFMTIKEAWTPLIDMLLHKWDDAVEHKRNVKLVSYINDAGFPILLVGSAMDILIPPREMQTLHEHLKGDHVETLFFEQGGHGVIMQYPEEIADGLTKLFLRC